MTKKTADLIRRARELAALANKATLDPDDMELIGRAREIARVLRKLANELERAAKSEAER